MNTEKQIDNKPEYYNALDEIDLFDLIKKIWKWKWLTIAIIILTLLLSFLHINSKQDTFTSSASLKIGKIADQNIDSINIDSQVIISSLFEIITPLNKKINLDNKDALKRGELQIIKSENKSIDYNTDDFIFSSEYISGTMATIKITSGKPDLSFHVCETLINKIIKKHGDIYSNGYNKLTNNITFFRKKNSVENDAYFNVKYLIDAYNYPSEIIKSTDMPLRPDSKKMKLILAVAFFASLFFGIFISFFMEYIIFHKKEN